MSFAQQRLWFLYSLETGRVAYILPEALRLVGTLDVVALRRALEEMVRRRHESLRTSFGQQEGFRCSGSRRRGR